MAERKKIGTHDGSFHCDEALACFLLRHTDEYKDAEVVRTRDAKVLATLPIIVDVGAEYDFGRGRLDHHQRGFNHTFSPEHKIKLSSAGLVYKHFGKPLVKKFSGCEDAHVELLYRKVYDSFVQALDGVDNGVSQFGGDPPPPRNYDSHTDLPSRVSRLNPAWNEEGVDVQKRFEQAMALAGGEFVDCVRQYSRVWLPARTIVEKSIEERLQVHPSGQIMLLKQFTVWKDHLFTLEKEMKIKQLIYILYQDTGGQWRIQCVPEAEQSFASRKALPEPWRGVRDEELSRVSEIPGCVFTHASGFIGGNRTYEGVLAMAVKSLEWDDQQAPKRSKVE